ncbi:amino acid adenylation domain-containing protein [Streptomyces sp. NPDC050610]|uniref:non-ribosomal peptide synthetase n=1 Tax=Streptomyces sp. NPDC050610 TaxID=3157097 RepID=UPI00342AC71F
MTEAPASPRTPDHTSDPARPASAAQSGIWFNESLADCGAVHNIAFTVRLDGDLDIEALRRACAAVQRAHWQLGRAVEDRAGVPHLVPAPVQPELVVEPERPDALRAYLADRYDLARGPLFRPVLQIVGPRAHRLLLLVHHIVFDGLAMQTFVNDLAARYEAEIAEAADGGPGPMAPVPEEPAGAEEERIAAKLPAARRYWAQHPPGDDDVVLPGLEGPAQGAGEGDSVEFGLPEELHARLGPLAERIGVSRFELLTAAFHAVLFRYGNKTPVTALDLGTRTPEQRHHIGVHVNELPFASAPEGGTPFEDFARAVRSGLRELYQVREVPLGRAGARVRPGVALAPVTMSYRRMGPPPSFAGLDVSVEWQISNRTARNALRAELTDTADGFDVMLQYPPDAMTREGAESVARHWLSVLGHVTAAPGTPLAELPLTGPDERKRLLSGWHDTTRAYPARTVPELIAEHAARTPDAVAVVHADRRLTYAELDADADRLAARLRGRGIGHGSLVAVRTSRSERLLVALLGVLKAGAAYVPLDSEYPAERLKYVMEDSRAVVELTDADLAPDASADDGPDAPVPAEPPAPGDLAYVIYTSGSTGRPKGVQIEHRSLTNLLLSVQELLGARPADTWLALTSVSFDISGLELFLPLITGATVVVASESQTRDGAQLTALAARHEVTHVQATPTGWAMLLDGGFDAPGVTALVGGEALPLAFARRLRPRTARLVNVYGPTETTIWSTAQEIGPDPDRVTIGRPLANTRTYVLDERLSPVPVGVPGDLYIAGAGLARGYVGRPDLDAERFPPDPYGRPGSRMYRTGDRVRHRPDGQLEFRGRSDDQIKLRGYRIELGEIESRLLAADGVDRAAVAVRDGRLVGYHVGGSDAGELRRALAAALPAYMVPEAFVALDALPTTPNGKLDRAALPEPPEPAAPASAGVDSPLEAVREIWCEVLRLPTLGDTEDLFDLGGHSITMTQISTRILERLDVDVPLSAYFDEPTVRGIAAVVADLQETQ